MGPKIEDIEVKFNIEDSILQATLPYNKAYYQKTEEENANNPESPKVRTDAPSASEDSEEADALRVSTRARYSYELDRYSKNAMLIFEGNISDMETFENRVERIEHYNGLDDGIGMRFRHIFEKYRFEVELYRNLNDEAIASTCDRFFQRDFTEYGCVAVMMLAETNDGMVVSSHTPESEYGVLRYMYDLTPPTLQGKPKIFIVQTERYYVTPRARVWSMAPLDTYEFRVAVPNESALSNRRSRPKVYCLLEHFYEKIKSLADQTALQTIITTAVHEYVNLTHSFHSRDTFEIYSTLTRELLLARTSDP